MHIYNKKRHKELVKHAIDLKNQGKSFIDENREDYFELGRYDDEVAEQITWAYREEFVKTIKDFLTKNIDFDEFDSTFSALYWRTIRENKLFKRDLKQIEKFEPSTRPERFNRVIYGIYRTLEAVEDEYTSEQEAMNYVKETCLRYKVFNDEVDIWT